MAYLLIVLALLNAWAAFYGLFLADDGKDWLVGLNAAAALFASLVAEGELHDCQRGLMGLDIYLYRYDNHAETQRLEDEYQRASEAEWNRVSAGRPYEQLTDSDKQAARSACVAVAEKLGLDSDGDDPRKTCIELPSQKYPDHMFKVGYFRSSYNDGGINAVLRAAVGAELADFFGYSDDYSFRPNWHDAKRKTETALAALREANAKRPYRAVEVGRSIFGGDTLVSSEAASLNVFQRQKDQTRDFHSFSCRDGVFWLKDPLRVVAAIHGKGGLGQPCVYLVYEQDAEGMAWYEQALEIVIETCDYVLGQSNSEQFYLHWSG